MKTEEEEHQTSCHTSWRIWAMLENLLSASIWTADLTSLIVAVSFAGLVFRGLQMVKLPGSAGRLPVYLLSAVLCRVLMAALPPFQFSSPLPH